MAAMIDAKRDSVNAEPDSISPAGIHPIDHFVRDIPFSRRHPTWQTLESIEAGLPSLAELPIQLIWGMRDWCFRPECLDRFASHWPNAKVHKLDDCGHYVVEDAHERIVPLVAGFLDRVGRDVSRR